MPWIEEQRTWVTGKRCWGETECAWVPWWIFWCTVLEGENADSETRVDEKWIQQNSERYLKLPFMIILYYNLYVFSILKLQFLSFSLVYAIKGNLSSFFTYSCWMASDGGIGGRYETKMGS